MNDRCNTNCNNAKAIDNKRSTSRPNSSRLPPIAAPRSTTFSCHSNSVSPLSSLFISCEPQQRPHTCVTRSKHFDREFEFTNSLKREINSLPSIFSPQTHTYTYSHPPFKNIDFAKLVAQNEIETNCDQQILLKNKANHLAPLIDFNKFIDRLEIFEELRRLKLENESLQNNFVKMNDIIRNCNKQLSRKDAIILSLQQKNSQNISGSINNLIQDNLEISKFDSCFINLLRECVIKPINMWKETDNDIENCTQLIAQIIERVVTEIRPLIINLNNNIDQLSYFSENRGEDSDKNETDLNKDCEEIRIKLQELRVKQLEMNDSYDRLFAEYNDLKKLIVDLCNIFEMEDCNDVTINLNNLRNFFNGIIREKRDLEYDLDSLKHFRSTVEENICNIIEIVSDIELELELMGRSPKILNSIIQKFSIEYQIYNPNGVSMFLPALKKLLIQIYRSQLKWLELNSVKQMNFIKIQNSSGEVTDNSKNINTVELPSIIDDHCQYLFSNSNSGNKLLMQNLLQLNTIKDISSEATLDAPINDEIDADSINYILLNKALTQTMLEVVNEEEEETENNVEQQVNECFITEQYTTKNQCQTFYDFKVNKNLNYYETDEDIENSIKQVMDDLLNKVNENITISMPTHNKGLRVKPIEVPIEVSTAAKSVMVSSIRNSTEFKELSLPLVYEIPFVKVDASTINSVINQFCDDNEKLSDSAFVSDDNCSSPEIFSTARYNCVKHFLGDTTKKLENVSRDELSIIPQKTDSDILYSKLKQLEEQREWQKNELLSANSRISKLESMIKLNVFDGDVLGKKQQSSHYYTDELNAWKELVDHQKVIMQKIMSELEETKGLLQEKTKEINLLRKPETQCSIKNCVETQTDTIIHDIRNVDNDDKASIIYSESDYDVFGLNQLFFTINETKMPSDSSVNQIDLISNAENNHSLDEQNVCAQQIVLTNQCNNSSNINQSIESLCSTDTLSDTRSPISTFDNILIRKSISSINSDESYSQRKHSCQSKVVHYGDHPRKQRLQLKKVELIYNPKDKMSPKSKEKLVQR